MTSASRLLRVGLAGFSIYVLSGIVPISLAHWKTGDSCPTIGPIAACYVVTMCYAMMGLAALLWTKRLAWLFFAGGVPVVLLALSGSVLELAGQPTCPRSAAGTPLCYYSFLAGAVMLATFLTVKALEKRSVARSASD